MFFSVHLRCNHSIDQSGLYPRTSKQYCFSRVSDDVGPGGGGLGLATLLKILSLKVSSLSFAAVIFLASKLGPPTFFGLVEGPV